MADFKTSEDLTGASEGGWVNNPDDKGGETIYGVSHKNWANWPGWVIVDKYKLIAKGNIKLLNQLCNADETLQVLKHSFYKKMFWDVNKLDRFNDQQIANTVYDFGVTSFTTQAAKTLQRLLGVTDDGIIGNATITAVNAANAEFVHAAYNASRATFYHELALKPGQAQFLKSWLSRLKPYQK